MSVLVFVDHDRGVLTPTATQAFALARELASDGDIVAVACGSPAASFAASLGAFGARSVRILQHPALDAGAPEAIGDAVAAMTRDVESAALDLELQYGDIEGVDRDRVTNVRRQRALHRTTGDAAGVASDTVVIATITDRITD